MIGGTRAAAGDTVITRHNDRRLRSGRGWVSNSNRWTVTDVRDDDSLALRRAGRKRGGSVVIPADYAAEHLELGYAVTSHFRRSMNGLDAWGSRGRGFKSR